MASLFTSLCRVGGEEIDHRLDQPGYSVLSRLGVNPDTVLAGGVGGYRTYASDQGPRKQPRRYFRAEGPHQILDRRAGGEGNAVDSSGFQLLRQLFSASRRRYGFVGWRDDDFGAGFAEPLGQDLARHPGAGDENLLSRERATGHLLDEGFRPELLRHHVN